MQIVVLESVRVTECQICAYPHLNAHNKTRTEQRRGLCESVEIYVWCDKYVLGLDRNKHSMAAFFLTFLMLSHSKKMICSTHSHTVWGTISLWLVGLSSKIPLNGRLRPSAPYSIEKCATHRMNASTLSFVFFVCFIGYLRNNNEARVIKWHCQPDARSLKFQAFYWYSTMFYHTCCFCKLLYWAFHLFALCAGPRQIDIILYIFVITITYTAIMVK